MARATHEFLRDTAVPAWGRLGGGLRQVDIAASYECRTRNNQPGAPLSEHGRGQALDIRAFTLQNGTSISVETGWRDPLAGQVMRKIRKGGCRHFAHVIGPDDDRYHRDHLHFDIAGGRTRCR